MENIVIYCKSYKNDVSRVEVLLASINKHNKDNIPFYVSVPKSDVSLFKNKLGTSNYNLLVDEDICAGNNPGWIQQQIVKSSFWRLNLCENYVCIDSDAYFIKDFYEADFIYEGNIPYTVIHEQKELFSWTVGKTQDLGFDPKFSYIEDRKKIMDLFGRKGKYYDFGPSPTIWSSKVWKSLEEKYTEPNNLTFSKLIEYSNSEFSWYGEALLNFKSIPIYPIEPLFKVFHYPQQLLEYNQKNYTEEMISQNYYGIILQSNYTNKLKY
mgnify:CR=1 FL=1